MAQIKEDGRIEYDQITRPVEVQANYLASRQDDHYVDDAIALYTGLMPWNWPSPPVSHTEVGYWLDGELWFFSSTSRKELSGKNGTRWIKGTELLRNPERWKLQEKDLGICNGAMFKIRDRVCRANAIIGLGYDFYGVGADFINPVRVFIKKDLVIQNIIKLKKIYCSKAVHAVQTGKLVVFSPRRKYKWAKKNGYKLIDNTWNYIERCSAC
jgi:hypothetical protein